MESRRIRLYTLAYLNGWLDFKKRFKWDSTREEVILHVMEMQVYSEMMSVKTLKDAAITSGAMGLGKGAEFAKGLDSDYNQFLRFKLPSLVKDSTMDKDKQLKPDEFNAIKEFLAASKIKKE